MEKIIITIIGVLILSIVTIGFILSTYKDFIRDVKAKDFGGVFIWFGAIGLCLFSLTGLVLMLMITLK